MNKYIATALMLSVACTGVRATEAGQGSTQATAPLPYSAAFTRATHIHSLPIATGKVSDQLPALRNRAEAGDAKAAATIYASLVQCRALSTSVTTKDTTGNCNGLTAADTAEAGKWLEMAAARGDADAQYAYAAGGFDDVLGEQRAESDPAALNHYVSNAKQYLTGLAEQCNFDAIGALATAYGKDGLVFGKDANQAYTYLVIKQTLARVPNKYDASYQAYLEKNITAPATVASLRQEASSFVTQHCR